MSVRRLHPHLEERREERIALLRIDREEALGALSRSLVQALHDYLIELASDPEVRVLVVTGTGRSFVAGADVIEYDGADQHDFDSYQRLGRVTFEALEGLPQPTIAAVNGYALGGGFELALCCDFIVADEQASFGLPEIRLGLVPGGGGTQRLARQGGPRLAKEALLTGRSFTAAEMARAGLLSVPEDGQPAREAAWELALRLARRAPLAAAAAKKLVDQGVQLPLDEALGLEHRVLSEVFATADAAEGIRAFVEKRRPEFRGE